MLISAPMPFDEATDLGEIGGHVEDAVAGADNVDARLFAWRARSLRLGARPFFRPYSLQSQLMARLAHCH